MAAVGRAARAQVRQLCAAGQRIRVAGFRSTTQAELDRSQSALVPNGVPAGITWEDLGITYPAWCRGAWSGYSRGFSTKDGADEVTGAGKTSASSEDIGEEMRVDSMVRDELEEPEGGPEPGLKEKAKQAVSKVGEKVRDAGHAIKGSTDHEATSKVGDTVKGAGETLKDKGTQRTSVGKDEIIAS